MDRPSVGRIVLVRSPALTGECAAIVTAAHLGETPELDSVNVSVFPDVDSHHPHVRGLTPQSESSVGWGWRWPPRQEPVDSTPAADVVSGSADVAGAVTVSVPGSGAAVAESPAGEQVASGV